MLANKKKELHTKYGISRVLFGFNQKDRPLLYVNGHFVWMLARILHTQIRLHYNRWQWKPIHSHPFRWAQSVAKSRKKIVIRMVLLFSPNVQPYKYWMEIIYVNGIFAFSPFLFSAATTRCTATLYAIFPTYEVNNVGETARRKRRDMPWQSKTQRKSNQNIWRHYPSS